MTEEQVWVALVTFERCHERTDILPEWAHGACGWMAAMEPSEEAACRLLVRDVEHHGLHVVEISDLRTVRAGDDVQQLDEHLVANFRNIEPGKQTVWGTLHCYKGEGEA